MAGLIPVANRSVRPRIKGMCPTAARFPIPCLTRWQGIGSVMTRVKDKHGASCPYKELGGDCFDRRNVDATQSRLVKKLTARGYKVT
jgi:hypothetical protein